MSDLQHRAITTNGIRMHIAEQGAGPLVVLLHGFPELWYSWRHQLAFLAQAGYHVVAPDQRGYGETDRPEDVRQYTMLHLVGDVIGLLDALGEEQAVVVGHDWGAQVAWNSALLRPERVRGVVGLSVPYVPRGPASTLTAMRTVFGEGFYMAYFQQPGVADSELARDPRATIRRLLYSASGDASAPLDMPVVPPGGGFLDLTVEPETLPSWLSNEDLDTYATEFERTGFTGGLNWYRTIDASWELMAAWQGAKVITPALFVAGDRDLVVRLPGMLQHIQSGGLRSDAPNLRGAAILDKCGHWTQQEQPAEVNRALLDFLAAL